MPTDSEPKMPSSSSMFKKRKKKKNDDSQSNHLSRRRVIESKQGELAHEPGEDPGPSNRKQPKKLMTGKQVEHDPNRTSNPPSPPVVVKFNRRKNPNNLNPLRQATSTKRLKSGRNLSPSADDEDEDEDESEGEGDHKSHPKTVGVTYRAKGSAREQAEENELKKLQAGKASTDRTDTSTTDLLDAQPNDDDDDEDQKNVYLGQSKSKYQLPKGSMKYGPIKGGPNNIRTITVVDYQPDVCKDYKETGYCGFGDTCKFLHDRGDYMHGWQLDDAFASSRDRRRGEELESEEEEEVPFACLICRQPFTDPIVTKCQHYYCSSCAIKRFAKTPKCFACGAPTGGIFNKATRIIEKMKLKQERIKRQKEERRLEAEGLTGIEGLVDQSGSAVEEGLKDGEGSERSFYEDE